MRVYINWEHAEPMKSSVVIKDLGTETVVSLIEEFYEEQESEE